LLNTSSGVIGSPQLLLLSGIGPKEDLKELKASKFIKGNLLEVSLFSKLEYSSSKKKSLECQLVTDLFHQIHMFVKVYNLYQMD